MQTPPIMLPDSFKHFEKEKEITIPLGEDTLTLSFKVASSFDTVWASTEASSKTLDLQSMGCAYVPKILSATLTGINGKKLMHYVPSKLQEIKRCLNPQVRKYLTEEKSAIVNQWVYEAVVSRIPLEILNEIYKLHLKNWFNTAGNLISPEISSENGKVSE